jgi:putative transposase
MIGSSSVFESFPFEHSEVSLHSAIGNGTQSLIQKPQHLAEAWQVVVRCACRIFPANRATYNYRPRSIERAELKPWIKDIAQTRVRYGYRRIHAPLRRDGWAVNPSRPREPTDNVFIESLNGTIRAECLNANWFLSLDEARRKCEAWRGDYNKVRPHGAIGNKVPMELHRMATSPVGRQTDDVRIL